MRRSRSEDGLYKTKTKKIQKEREKRGVFLVANAVMVVRVYPPVFLFYFFGFLRRFVYDVDLYF